MKKNHSRNKLKIFIGICIIYTIVASIIYILTITGIFGESNDDSELNTKAYNIDYTLENKDLTIADVEAAPRKNDIYPEIPSLDKTVSEKLKNRSNYKDKYEELYFTSFSNTIKYILGKDSPERLRIKDEELNKKLRLYLPIFDVKNINGKVFYTNKKNLTENLDNNKFYIYIGQSTTTTYLRCIIRYRGLKFLDLKNVLIESNLLAGAYMLDISDDEYRIRERNGLIEEYTDFVLDEKILELLESLQFDDNLKITLMGFENNASWEMTKSDIRSLKLTYEFYKILKEKYNQQ